MIADLEGQKADIDAEMTMRPRKTSKDQRLDLKPNPYPQEFLLVIWTEKRKENLTFKNIRIAVEKIDRIEKRRPPEADPSGDMRKHERRRRSFSGRVSNAFRKWKRKGKQNERTDAN
jgi:hypothetical protein